MTVRNMVGVGVGYHPEYRGAYVWNRTGATVALYDIVMFDQKIADAGFGGNASQAAYADVTAMGSDGHPLSNVTNPTTAGIGATSGDPGFIFGVVDDLLAGAGADDTLIHICIKGITKIKMTSTVGAEDTVPGEYGKVVYCANGVRTGTTTFTAGLKPIARLLEENTVAATASACLLNGEEGITGAMYAN